MHIYINYNWIPTECGGISVQVQVETVGLFSVRLRYWRAEGRARQGTIGLPQLPRPTLTLLQGCI